MELSSIINAKSYREKAGQSVGVHNNLQCLVVSIVLHARLKLPLKCTREHLKILKISNIPGGACPQVPLDYTNYPARMRRGKVIGLSVCLSSPRKSPDLDI